LEADPLLFWLALSLLLLGSLSQVEDAKLLFDEDDEDDDDGSNNNNEATIAVNSNHFLFVLLKRDLMSLSLLIAALWV